MSLPSVLIIANPYEAQLVARAAQECALRVVVSDGEGAVDKFQREAPSLIVLALGLYAADSSEVLAGIRAASTSHVPLVVVGDPHSIDADVQAAHLFGVDRWLDRPIDVPALGQALREIAEGQALAEELADEVDEVYAAVARAELRPSERAPRPQVVIAEAPRPEPIVEVTHAHIATQQASGDEAAPEPPPRKRTTQPMPILRMDDPESLAAAAMFHPAPIQEPPPPMPVATPFEPTTLVELTPAAPAEPEYPAAAAHISSFVLNPAAPEGAVQPPTGVQPPRRTPTPAASGPALDRGDDLATPGYTDNIPPAMRILAAAMDVNVKPMPPRHTRPYPEVAIAAGSGALRVNAEEGEMRSDAEVALAASTTVPEGGVLADLPLAVIIGRLHRLGFTGSLVLSSDAGERILYFDSGLIVAASSTLSHDSLGELLWREGRVTRTDVNRCRELEHLDETTSPRLRELRLVERLAQQGRLPREELPAVLRGHAEELVYAVFAWEDAHFALRPEAAPAELRVRLTHPYALVVEGVRRKLGLDRLLESVGPADTVIHALPTIDAVMAAADLEAAEESAVALLRSRARPVSELCELSGLDQHSGYVLIYALLALEAARREQVPSAQRGRVHERVLAKLAVVNDGDYFAVLGVSREATGYEIRRAWEQARRDFAPERFAVALRRELAAELGEIRNVIDEAYLVLSDDRTRADYRAHLPA